MNSYYKHVYRKNKKKMKKGEEYSVTRNNCKKSDKLVGQCHNVRYS